MKARLILLILFLAQHPVLLAQRPESGIWLALQLPVQIGNQWQWHQDAGYRTDGFSMRPSQYLYRTGIRYRWNADISVAAGIAGFFTKSLVPADAGEFEKEFRYWQELHWAPEGIQPVQWQLRTRAEQRFFAGTNAKHRRYVNRFRLRAAVTTRIRGSWSVQLADEWMEQLQSRNFSFDQNRVMLNIVRKGRDQSQWLAGYMWLLWPNESQHIISVTYQKTIKFNDYKSTHH